MTETSNDDTRRPTTITTTTTTTPTTPPPPQTLLPKMYECIYHQTRKTLKRYIKVMSTELGNLIHDNSLK